MYNTCINCIYEMDIDNMQNRNMYMYMRNRNIQLFIGNVLSDNRPRFILILNRS